jgi:hypothetical protein
MGTIPDTPNLPGDSCQAVHGRERLAPAVRLAETVLHSPALLAFRSMFEIGRADNTPVHHHVPRSRDSTDRAGHNQDRIREEAVRTSHADECHGREHQKQNFFIESPSWTRPICNCVSADNPTVFQPTTLESQFADIAERQPELLA